jgi:HSP20 family protein
MVFPTTTVENNPTIERTKDMNNLRVMEPTFGDTIESAFRRFLSPVALDADTAALNMRLDVAERDDAYEVKADLPGVKKEDINVRIDGNLVQIDAEIKREKETRGNGNRVLRSERYQGSISRSFSLSQDVEEGKAKARYADGVLTLELPKKTSATARKVQIQ